MATLAGCVGTGTEDDSDSSEDAVNSGDLESVVARATENSDTPGVKFSSAASTAYQVGRPGFVNFVVIHDVEGSGRSAYNLFSKPGNESSAHYVVDREGFAIQMVRETDIANHAFQSMLNGYAIGIEHAGFAARGDYTEKEYEASAKIVASIVTRHHIPIDREHIVGHHQVPKKDEVVAACPTNATTCGGQGGHVDPGPNWKWDQYMALVEREARALGYTAPSAAEQQKRALKAIAPLEKLSVSKGVFGGYWATQCTKEDRNVQDTFRTILKPNEAPRLETRYQQARHGDCGDATNGIYPMVLRGLPVANAPRPDLDVSGLEITRCESGVKRVYKVDGRTTSCLDGRGSDCRDVVAGFVREAGGC